MSAELVTYREQSSLDIMPQSWAMAEKIAGTDFVPASFRGKPEAVLAAILFGHELGIGPMTSLQQIHVIEGRPAMAAQLMRGLVVAAGHELWTEDSNSTRCTVVARRAGTDRELKFTWTMDDAKKAGLDGRKNWRSYPRAMLMARATSEAVRAVFPDVIAGISYSLEELTDGEVVDPEDLPGGATSTSAPRRARARKAATAQRAVQAVPDPPAARELPPLPGEEMGGQTSGVGVEHVEAEDPPPDGDLCPLCRGSGEIDKFTAKPVSGTIDAMRCPTCNGAGELGNATDGPTLSAAASVAIWIRENCGGDAVYRHHFLEAFSGGTYSSGNDVPVADMARVRATAVRVKRGELELVERDGRWQLVTPVLGWETTDPAGEHRNREVIDVNLPLDIVDADYWRRAIDGIPGVGIATLVKQARSLAASVGVEPPSGLDTMGDPRLVAVLKAWLDEKRATP